MKAKRKSLALLLAIVLAIVLTIGLAACTKTYTITFDSDGGSAVGSITVKGKESPSAPSAPTKEGYTFEKWIKPNGDEFLFGTDTVKEDITLKAVWRKNTYTVRFVTEGGTSVSPQSVEHGGKAKRPDDPVKSGEIFCDWYGDSEYKELFDFKTAITADTTVYARFELPSMYTYKVSFAGTAVAIADRETNEAGILTNLPKPEESGKVFAGWWMSDFEDAGKLTCEYTGQVLTQNVTLFAVWESENPEVSVNESGVYWASEGVNVSYRVEITAPDGNKETRTLGTTEYAYDFASKEAGEYKVEVTYNNKTTTVYYNNKALSRVSVFEVDGFVLKFNKVLNAEKYLVTVKCGNTSHEHEMSFTDMETTSGEIDFTLCEMTEEGIVFVVKAVADGYVTSESEAYVFERHLDKVTGLGVKAEDETIVFDKVTNAEYYEYQINDGEWTRYDGAVSLKEMAQGDIVVRVRAFAHGYNSSEVAEFTYAKTRLATPSADSITMNGLTLSWGEVAGAVSYTVTIDGVEYNPGNVLSMELDEADWAMTVEISVRANGATAAENSLNSDVKIFASTLKGRVEYEDGYAVWSTVIGAEKYEVRVNGGASKELTGTRYKIELEKKGLNTIEVRSCDGDGTWSEWELIEVEAWEVKLMYNMEGYESYLTLYRAQNDPLNLPYGEDVELVGYDFDYWMEASNGVAYTGTKLEKAEDLTLYAHWTPKEYTVTFVVAGGTMSETTFKVTYRQNYVLPTPESDLVTKAFSGWYTAPGNEGIQYTDYTGTGQSVWLDAKDMTLYAHWVDVFEFFETEQSIGGGQSIKGYSVKKGEGIDYVTEVTIPAEYNGLPVIDISGGAFDRCTNLKKISIPDTIKNIDYGSSGGRETGSPFSYCSNIEEVAVYVANPNETYETRYTSVDGVLFEYSDTELKSSMIIRYFPAAKAGEYVLPDGVVTLPINVFKNTRITSITIPASVSKIDNNVFEGCSKLVRIEFLDGEGLPIELTELSFDGAAWVTELILPTRIENFNPAYFSYMSRLEKISFTDDNGEYRAVDGLVVNKAADTIIYAPRTFSGENGVFTIPLGINKIADNAFANPYKRTKTITGYYGCKITKLIVPEYVTEIGENAFRGCSSIGAIEFSGNGSPLGLKIAARAFHNNTSLTQLTLPANLISLGVYAFGYCSKLERVDVQVKQATAALVVDAFCTDPQYIEDMKETNPSATIDSYYVKFVNLGAAVTIFDIGGVFGNKLQGVTVDPNNQSYTAENGVVYSKNFSEILYFPYGKTGEFVLHEDVVTINSKVFMNASMLTKVTIGAKVTKIGDSAFGNCTSLKTVVFASSDEVADGHSMTIEDSAFVGCSSLTEFVIPDYVTKLGSGAFKECTSLTTIIVPGNVKTLGDEVFASCSSLQNAIFEEGVEEIGKKVFADCKQLLEVSFPATLTSIAIDDDAPLSNTFLNSNNVSKVNIANGNEKYASIDGVVYGYTLKEGSQQSALTDLLYCPVGASGKDGVVDIPNTVEYISAGAFKNNKNITEIKFSQGILGDLEIGADAFSGCQKLATITLPAGLKTMKTGLFNNCTSLVTLTIPNTVSRMEVNIFIGCTNLANIIFEEGNESNPLVLDEGSADNVATSGQPCYDVKGVFFGANALDTLELPNRVSTISKYAFSYGGAPKTLIIPSSVTKIDEHAFYSLASYTDKGGSTVSLSRRLETVKLVENSVSKLASIGKYAFYGCINLSNFEFPDSLTEIGEYVFTSNSLKTVSFGDDSMLKSIGDSAFTSSSQLTTLKLPASLETIGNSAFSSLKTLTTVSFEPYGNLKSIGEHAFKGCSSLTSISIPASVETIETWAFGECSSIKTVKFEVYPEGHENQFKNSLVSIGSHAFRETALTDFYVPESIAENGTTLGESLFYRVGTLSKIKLSKTVATINGVLNDSFVTQIEIDPESLYLQLDDELPIITNGNGTVIELSYGPIVGEDGVYTVPNGVTKIGVGAFDGQITLKKVVLPYTLQEIGKNAFYNCYSLEEVVFMTDTGDAATGVSNLTTMGESAFYNCTALKAIDLSRTKLAHIPANAFFNCSVLASVSLPTTLVSIGNSGTTLNTSGANAFQDCTALTSITFPSGLKYINGSNNFKNTGLTSVTLPASLEMLGNSTFANCASLKEATFTGNITSFGSSVFSSTALEKVVLSDKMETLGSSTFNNLKTLKIVTYDSYTVKDATRFNDGYENALPPSLTSLPSSLFSGCTSLKSMDLSNVKTVAGSLFKGCSALESVVLSTDLEVLGDYMFQNCTSLSSIEIPSSVTSLGKYAFDGCTKLTSIDLPETLTFMGTYTFRKTGLTSIVIPSGVKSFGTSATECAASSNVYLFAECKSLTTVVLPANINDFKIGGYVFNNCTKLTTIKVGADGEENVLDGVTLVAQYAFSGCGITELSLPDVTEVGKYSFSKGDLQSISLPALTKHAEYVFSDSKKLTSVTLNDELESLAKYMFNGCTALEQITLPSSLVFLNTYTFKGSGLKEIVIPEGVKHIGSSQNGAANVSTPINTFENCASLVKVTLPAGLETIGREVFKNCSNLTIVTYTGGAEYALPASTRLVGNYAFQGCKSLTALEMKGVETLGINVFDGCSSLTSVDLSSLSTMGENVFEDCGKLLSVVLNKYLSVISEEAFLNCTSLEAIELPEALTTISANAFKNSGLTSVNLPESLTSLAVSAFAGCNALQTVTTSREGWRVEDTFLLDDENTLIFAFGNLGGKVTIPDGCVTIGEYAFNGREVSEVVFPASLERIEAYAFSSTNLTNLVLPANIKEIGNYAFSSSALQSVEFNSADAVLGEGIFSSCTKLADVKLCEGVKALGKKMFQSCSALQSIELPQSLVSMGTYTFYKSGLVSITIPESVKHLGDADGETGTTDMFRDCKQLKSVVLPSNLSVIGGQTFYGATSLSSVTYHGYQGEGNSLPQSVTALGNKAFSSTKALLQLDLPGVKETGDSIFAESGITQVSLPALETVGSKFFDKCASLESVTLNDSLTALGAEMFTNCTSLKTIDLPSALTFLNVKTFRYSGLTSVVIPENVVHLGSAADTEAGSTVIYLFDSCTSLVSVTFPSGLRSIGAQAFSNCTSLKNVTYTGYEGEGNALPETLTTIKKQAFYKSGIEQITLPASLVFISSSNHTIGESAFAESKQLREVTMLGAALVGQKIFQNCTSLETVVLSGELDKIPNYTFDGCKALKNITLPSTLTSIGIEAFKGCTSIESVVLPASVALEKNVFNGWTAEQTINVKTSYYMSTRLWNSEWNTDCSAKVVWNFTEQD